MQIAAAAFGIDDLTQQDGAAIAQLRRPAAELMPGIGLRQRIGAFGHRVACQHLHPVRAAQRVRVEPQLSRQRIVEQQQPWRGDRRRRHARMEALRQGGIGIVEWEM